MGKGSKAPDTARLTNSTVIYAAKWKILVQEVQYRLINTAIASTGFLKHFVGNLGVIAVDI